MFSLMAHQVEGVDFLLRRGSGLLAFEQGLGKTLIAIEAYQRLRARGKVNMLLVVAPNSLKETWRREVAKFAPQLSVMAVEGSAKTRRAALSKSDADVVIINYESARLEITGLRALLSRRRAVLVLDESHSIKNHRSLTSIAARHFAALAPYRWLLTGTPVTNTPLDVYTQIEVVGYGHELGSFGAFEVIYGGKDSTSEQRQALAKKIEPYLLRRRKEECVDLPEKTFVDVYVELPAWQRRLYDQMRHDLVCQVETMSQGQYSCFAPTALTQLLRLSQLASNPSLVLPGLKQLPAKFRELDGMLDELVVANHRKVIVWSYYVETIRALERRFGHLGAASLYGQTPVGDRQRLVEQFQHDPGLRILIANPAAAGTGFTLTAANYSIYETLTWRYDHYAQSQDRNHRIGQDLPVTYTRLIAVDTIEEVIAEAMDRKANIAASILGDSYDTEPLTKLSPEGFCHMIRTNRLPA